MPFPPGGIEGKTSPAILQTFDRSRKTPVVRVDPFEALNAAVEAGIESEIRSIRRFTDTDAALVIKS